MEEIMNAYHNNAGDVNYDALDAMIARYEETGVFSLNDVRGVFGSVVDDAIRSEEDGTN